jgi:hypothetical protein
MFKWHELIGLDPMAKNTASATIIDRLFHWLLRAERLGQHETELYYKMEEIFDYMTSK